MPFNPTDGTRAPCWPNLDDIELMFVPDEEEGPPTSTMKRTQSSNLLCELCRQGIRSHTGPGAGFSETVMINGQPHKHWYHVKKCWPAERRRRKKEKRLEERKKQEATVAAVHDTVPPPINNGAEPKPFPGSNPAMRQRRGLGAKAYEIMDSIEPGKEWTAIEIEDRLKVHGFETTHATIQQMVWTYRTQRREADVVRRVLTKGKGALKVYMFKTPAPAEPPRVVSLPKSARKPKKEEPKPVMLQAVSHSAVEPPPPTSRPLPKPAPTPGLSHAELNRAFNDFQAFLLEALQDFKSELSKKLKS